MALPTVLAAAWLYGRWSSKRAILAALLLAAIGLAGVIHVAQDPAPTGWLVSVTLLIIGSNAILAMLLPYAAESYPAATRGRAVGWIAACTKLGGPLSQGLTLLGMVPALGAAALVTALATVGAIALIAAFCIETREHALL
jgi:MFS transporter, putative metabolite:H+ symporter